MALKSGVVDCHVEAELVQRLAEKRPLKIKAGFDPTRPDLHLGHMVVLRKMRQFQDLGHEVVFLVGDFTAQIGDPSGRNQTRPVLSRDDIEQGARSYAEQAFKILDAKRTEIVYNNTWLGNLQFADVIRLAGKYTLARMMEREDFKTRWAEHNSIALHELLYPLAQAYDSVVLQCDVELGGTDQLFNLMVGREIMREYGVRPQIVMTTPLLEGTNADVIDGVVVGQKMSKSLDNYVGLDEPPLEQFGKLMSISDNLMWRYYSLLSARSTADIQMTRAAAERGELNPRDAKLALAKEIVGTLHDSASAQLAEQQWLDQFSKRQVPQDLPEIALNVEAETIWMPKALAMAGLVNSSSDGKRRLEQGGIEVDGARVTDPQATFSRGQLYLVKAGKRSWARLRIK